MGTQRGNIGASVPQPHLPPWPPPGGAELMGRVTTVPCLGTGVRSDQWGGDRGQQNNECLPQLAELPDQTVSQVPINPTPQPQVQGGHLEASLWLPQQRGVVRNTMGSHPAVHTPPVGRVGQEYPILQTHSNSLTLNGGQRKGTPLSSCSAGGAVSEQLESDNQLQPDSNNEGVHILPRESDSAVGQGVKDSASRIG